MHSTYTYENIYHTIHKIFAYRTQPNKFYILYMKPLHKKTMCIIISADWYTISYVVERRMHTLANAHIKLSKAKSRFRPKLNFDGFILYMCRFFYLFLLFFLNTMKVIHKISWLPSYLSIPTLLGAYIAHNHLSICTTRLVDNLTFTIVIAIITTTRVTFFSSRLHNLWN